MVAIDPIDGSSNVDVNVPIGTIFSIYRRKSESGPGTVSDLLQPGNQITITAGPANDDHQGENWKYHKLYMHFVAPEKLASSLPTTQSMRSRGLLNIWSVLKQGRQ